MNHEDDEGFVLGKLVRLTLFPTTLGRAHPGKPVPTLVAQRKKGFGWIGIVLCGA